MLASGSFLGQLLQPCNSAFLREKHFKFGAVIPWCGGPTVKLNAPTVLTLHQEMQSKGSLEPSPANCHVNVLGQSHVGTAGGTGEDME